MSNDKMPIKFFAPREIDELRIEGSGSSEPPKWLLSGEELEKRAQGLLKDFNQFKEKISDRLDRKSVVPFVFIAKMRDDSTAKSRRKDISSLFQTSEKRSVIGLVDSDELIVRLDSISDMEKISNRLTDFHLNSYAISCLESFSEFRPIIDVQDDDESYKVKIINFQDYELNLSLQRLFERKLIDNKIQFKKTKYAQQLPIYKIIVSNKAILDELQSNNAYEMLFSIEPMPKYTVELDLLHGEESIQIKSPYEGQRYETLGILDNGIAPIPHLTPWISGERWTVYPDKKINPTHGTFVGGVALYGDTLENMDWVGHKGIKLFDACIFPDETKEKLDEDDLIMNIQEAIGRNHENVKVWNLSISVTREC
jgi:hypothetical protein